MDAQKAAMTDVGDRRRRHSRTSRSNQVSKEGIYIWIPYDLPGKHADAQRDAYLREQGITVLRYSNSDVDRNFESVCTDILVHLTNI